MSFINISNLSGYVLVASGDCNYDYNFKNTVIYIYSDNSSGVSGVVLNRPSAYSLKDILNKGMFSWISSDLSDSVKNLSIKVLAGGTVAGTVGYLLQGDERLLTSRFSPLTIDLLKDIASIRFKQICYGYVFWPKSRLHNEIINGYWQVAEADFTLLYDNDYGDKYDLACAKVGFDSYKKLGKYGV